MRKTFSLALLTGLLVAACSGVGRSAPTATPVPAPTRVPTMIPPTLVEEIKLETQTGTAYTLAWSRKGETLAVASGGEITLFSADQKQLLATFKPEGGALGVTWNPDMTQFATVNGFRNRTITIWDLDTGRAQLTPARAVEAEADQYGVSWSPDGTRLAALAGDRKSVIQIWDTAKWAEIRTFDLSYTKPRRALQWSKDSSTVYGAGEAEGQMVVFALHVRDGSVQEIGKYPAAEAEVFAISPAENRLAISDPRGMVQIYDLVSGRALTGMKTVNQTVDIAWNPNGRTLAVLDYGATLQLWKVSE